MIEYFLPLVFGIGIIVAVKDIREGIIPNPWIFLLFVFALIFQFFSQPNLLPFLSIALSAFFMGIIFWEVGLWPGGDAKLFIALSLFFPASFYLSSHLLLNFLTNVFVPVGFFMIGVVFYKSNLNVIKRAVSFSLNPYTFLMLGVMLLGFVWLVTLPLKFLGIPPNYFVFLIVLFISFELLKKFFTAKTEYFFVSCAALRIVLDYNTVFSIEFVYNFFSMLLVFVFFRFFILHLSFHSYAKKIPLKELGVGMIPAEGIKKKGKKFEKEPTLKSSFIGYMGEKKKKYIHSMDSLKEENIKKIKNLQKNGKISFNSIKVYCTQPFAAFILLGFALTLLTGGGNFLLFLIRSFIH